MKYILLLLIPLNSFAEVNVRATDSKGFVSCLEGCKFDSQEKAQAWINKHIANDSWGKKKRWVKSSEVEDTSVCIKKRDIVPEKGEMYEECKLPKEYSILICDDAQTYNEGDPCKPITDEMKAKKAEKESRENEKREARNIKKLKKKWSQLNDNQKDKLIKYLLRNI